jgi:hypothetical protein
MIFWTQLVLEQPGLRARPEERTSLTVDKKGDVNFNVPTPE